jgi:hypothetical protein
MTQLELLTTEGDIVISDCPVTNYGRIARVVQEWNPMTKEVKLNCWVCYMQNGERINSKRFTPYNVILKATKDTFVNANTGEFVDSSVADAIPEYDFFVAMANNNINIFQVILNTVLLRDSQGRFNLD